MDPDVRPPLPEALLLQRRDSHWDLQDGVAHVCNLRGRGWWSQPSIPPGRDLGSMSPLSPRGSRGGMGRGSSAFASLGSLHLHYGDSVLAWDNCPAAGRRGVFWAHFLQCRMSPSPWGAWGMWHSGAGCSLGSHFIFPSFSPAAAPRHQSAGECRSHPAARASSRLSPLPLVPRPQADSGQLAGLAC